MTQKHYWLEVVENEVSTEYYYDNQLELFANIQKHSSQDKEIYFGDTRFPQNSPSNLVTRYVAIQKVLEGAKQVDVHSIRKHIRTAIE